MSVRAYKLIEIKTADKVSLTADEISKVQFLAEDEGFNGDFGFLTFYRDTIEDAIENTKGNKAILKRILKEIPEGEDSIEYYCY